MAYQYIWSLQGIKPNTMFLKCAKSMHTNAHSHARAQINVHGLQMGAGRECVSPSAYSSTIWGEEGSLLLLFWLMPLMRYCVLSKWSNLYFPWVLLSPLVRSCAISSVYLFTITQPSSLSLVSTPISHPCVIFFYRLPLTPINWPDFLSCSIYVPSLPFMFHYPTINCNVHNHQIPPH